MGKSGHATLQLTNNQLEIYLNRIGAMIRLTCRGFCVLLTVSTGSQYQKWPTWTTNGPSVRKPFYHFKTVLPLSVLYHDGEPFSGSERNTYLPKECALGDRPVPEQTTASRCNPLGIKIHILAKRCVKCHIKVRTLLIIVIYIGNSLIRSIGRKYYLQYVSA